MATGVTDAWRRHWAYCTPIMHPSAYAGVIQSTALENLMLYKKQTPKSVEHAFEDLQDAVKAHGFGVLHTYDFQKTLADKGFPLTNGCIVMDVCNPKQASEVLAMDMSLNMALPCRLSIYEEDGSTWIGMVPPTDQLSLISDDARVAEAARGVEAAMKAMIEEAV